MALQDIVEKILSDANLQAKKIDVDAHAEINKIFEQNEEQIVDLNKNKSEDILEKEKSMINKTNALSDGIYKNLILQKKRLLLKKAFIEAKKTLESLPEADIVNILVFGLKSINQDGVIYPAKDYTELVKKAIKIANKSFEVKNEKNFSSGFLFIGKDYEMDFTFENIIEQEVKPKLEIEIVNDLFSNT